MLRTVYATRYVKPLREGGSVPAIVEANDDGLYVLKFRGAAQGRKALIAELIAGEIGRALGLPIPEIVLMELDPALGRAEPHDEIRELIVASAGLNLALDYLPGSFGYDPLHAPPPDGALASAVVWFDAFVTNVDRTARNTNLLVWHRQLYLIDHGAALYVHHAWGDYLARARSPFAPIKDHVLLPLASDIRAADAALSPKITPELLHEVVSLVPQEWLVEDLNFPGIAAHREAYLNYLLTRIESPRQFVQEALRAREQLV
jgi:hypothetical protein